MAASLWPSGATGRSDPDPWPALVRVALQAGTTSVAHVDVAAMLSGICVALVPAAGVAGAAVLLREPADPRDPEARRVFGSDTAAVRLGGLQRRADAGPGPAAERGDRVLVTPDLTRSGPPELAAAAADCGLVRSLVVPVPIAGRPAGVLQLLSRGGSDDPLTERLAVALGPVVTALAARLADVRELARLERAATPPPAAPPARPAGPPSVPRPADPPVPPAPDADRTALIPAARRPSPPGTTGPRAGAGSPEVPAQRRARHRRTD